MYVNPTQISMETLIGVSPMLGHRLEDRGRIRHEQDRALIQAWQAMSTVALRNESQQELFCVAPLDIMVAEAQGRKQFHVLELNGTGIGGLTNLPGEVVSCVLDGLCQLAHDLPGTEPVVLVAVSGKENDGSPRLNKLMHEKVLYVEALKRGFEYSGREAVVTTYPALLQNAKAYHNSRPTIVLGYIKELVEAVALDAAGRLFLAGRQVMAGVNDRFCLNILQRFRGRDRDAGRLLHGVMSQFLPMNRCYLAGADKGVAYSLVNEHLAEQPRRALPERIHFVRVPDRTRLIETVLSWLRQGRKAVIKPQGTGLGHGIEFFLSPEASPEQISARVDASLKETEHYYGIAGGALPYTVCEYIDACTIRRPDHPLHGHRYELRVVVYRDGTNLKAFPSIVKISSEAFDAARPSHQSLINNITASAEAAKADGVEFMLPLANRQTLALLGLSVEEVQELCAFATGWVRHILDKVQDEPESMGLPARQLPALQARGERVRVGLRLGRGLRAR